MLPDTHTQRVLDLASQKGLLRASDLDAIDAPRVVLTRLTAAGLLEKVGRGLYRLPDSQGSEHESLADRRHQGAAGRVLPADGAAVPRTDHPTAAPGLDRHAARQPCPRIDYPPIKMVQFTGEAYTAGVEEVERDGVKLRVYGVAKTVADCFKHRNKIGLDVALEALKDVGHATQGVGDDLWRYAKICRVANVMRPYLESIG
jgi:hypothetical protein